MAHAVFDQGGTLDKYLGDGIMATFGTPRSSGRDAGNALLCTRVMMTSVEEWNAQRRTRGEKVIEIGVGVHYGPVVMGDIGSEQHLEFAVVGDTVNVASRLEELTRALGVCVLVSESVVEAAKREGTFDGFDLTPLGRHEIRGRGGQIALWGGYSAFPSPAARAERSTSS
jgi:adenylate cyclase